MKPPANDPDNLSVVNGRARLVCDFCNEPFWRRERDALVHLARNHGGYAYCGRACAAKAANRARVSGAVEAPSLEGIIRTLVDSGRADKNGVLARLTEPEDDMFRLLLNVSSDLRECAPPDNGDSWPEKARIKWERAEATSDAVLLLLQREIGRRDRYTRAVLTKTATEKVS